MSWTGASDGPPYRAGISVFDVMTGRLSAIGILAALHHRDLTGEGQHVETNLLSSALSTLVNQTSANIAGGVVPTRMGNAHLSLFPYEPLQTGDGELIIIAGNDAQFRRLDALPSVRNPIRLSRTPPCHRLAPPALDEHGADARAWLSDVREAAVAESISSQELVKRPTYPTALGASSLETITLLGQDLARDVMGAAGFGELAFWLATQRKPTPGQTRVFEAVLAALADHGFTPTAIATRLTYLSAPDSIQGALAAGLLGGGSRFLGVTADCGRFLHTILTDARTDGALPDNDDGWDALAIDTVQAQWADRRFIPGLGHHVHKEVTPAPPRLFQLAAEEELFGPHLSMFAAIGRVHPQELGKTLPLNGADPDPYLPDPLANPDTDGGRHG